MQIETTLGFPLTPRSIEQTIALAIKHVEKSEHLFIAGGSANWNSPCEDQCGRSPKT